MDRWVGGGWDLAIPKYRKLDLPFGVLRYRQIGKVFTLHVLGTRVFAKCGTQYWLLGLFWDADK